MNPFRNQTHRRCFEAAVRLWEARHRDLFTPEGLEKRGNSFATSFWRGYHHQGAGQWDQASRRTLGYVWWKAGQACKSVANVPPLGPSSRE